MSLDPLSAGFDLAGKVLDKIFPDPAQRAEAQMQLLQLQQSNDLAQISTNTEEAKSENLFVAGWRPFIGWICGAAFGYHFILQPFLAFMIDNLGGRAELPDFDLDSINNVLMGMLGLGSLRTIEKIGISQGKLPWQK